MILKMRLFRGSSGSLTHFLHGLLSKKNVSAAVSAGRTMVARDGCKKIQLKFKVALLKVTLVLFGRVIIMNFFKIKYFFLIIQSLITCNFVLWIIIKKYYTPLIMCYLLLLKPNFYLIAFFFVFVFSKTAPRLIFN